MDLGREIKVDPDPDSERGSEWIRIRPNVVDPMHVFIICRARLKIEDLFTFVQILSKSDVLAPKGRKNAFLSAVHLGRRPATILI